ncbi:MAG: hypothetical protein KGJ07_01565 [Patescibacteria group bacterium]|nr:hypothetical protein [Patescibacteria group bacterium]
MSATLFLGILLTSFGLDEYFPARTRIPVKLVVGIILIILSFFHISIF